MKKIELMHLMYGEKEDQCKDCRHFVRYRYHDRIYCKCKYYGMSHSEATDWAGRNKACGLFNEPFKEELLIEIMQAKKAKDIPVEDDIPGQLTLEF